jgi:hypothetical protein
MRAQVQPANTEPEPAGDLIDRIASALPEELRADYYRELSHCRNLPENDEMLRILRAMQFLTVLIEGAPRRLAMEREQLRQVLADAIESLGSAHQASIMYQKELEARLAKLPEEIAKGISAEAIAIKLGESLRQQFQQTGLPTVAEAIAVEATTLRQASKEFSAALHEFANPRTGAIPHVHEAVRSMKANLQNAGDHIRAQMNGLGKELYRAIAVLCVGALGIGFVMGILYYRWITTPAELPKQPAAAVQDSPQPSSTTPAPTRKRTPPQSERRFE